MDGGEGVRHADTSGNRRMDGTDTRRGGAGSGDTPVTGIGAAAGGGTGLRAGGGNRHAGGTPPRQSAKYGTDRTPPGRQITPGKEPRGRAVPDDRVSLISWYILEEKKEHSKDKKMLVALVGTGAAVLAVIAETYIFAFLLLIAAAVFITIMRKKQKEELLFDITTVGVFLDDDFLPAEKIREFNIIDDPGERARLILHMENFIHINEIVPIYDVHMAEIETVMEKMDIPKNETLKPDIFDRIARVI